MRASDVTKIRKETEEKQKKYWVAFRNNTIKIQAAFKKQARELLFHNAEKFVEERLIPKLVEKAKEGHCSYTFTWRIDEYEPEKIKNHKYCHKIPMNNLSKNNNPKYNTSVCDYEKTQELFVDFIGEALCTRGFSLGCVGWSLAHGEFGFTIWWK
jgi:hypothetical protein